MSQFVKQKILWHFSNIEEIIQGQILTSMFDDSLLPYVDDLVNLYENGGWKPTIMAPGYPNWYVEFIKYLESRNIQVVWK